MKQREKTDRAEFLDRTIPLDGASHTDVVSYSVDIPMRHAECFATLADGRKARLCDSRQFMGWSGRDGDRSFLFRSGGRRIVIDANTGRDNGQWNGVRKFVGRDGSLLFIRRWSHELATNIGNRMQTYAMPSGEPVGLPA